MKKITFILLLIIYSTLIFSQENNKELILTKDSDTIYWNKYKKTLVNKYDLGFVEEQNNKIVFRFWSYGSTIQISKDNDLYHGKVNYFVDEVDEISKRFFKKTFELNSEVCEKIVKLIDSSKINTLPSDKQIKGWQHGFDGITYFLEYKTKSEYSFKNYWTPTIQENVKEAVVVQNFVDELYKICETEKLSKIFQSEIPFICYTYNGGSTVTCRIMTKDEYRKYKREKKKKKYN